MGTSVLCLSHPCPPSLCRKVYGSRTYESMCIFSGRYGNPPLHSQPQTAPPTLPAPPTSTCPTHSACPAHSACPTHLCLPRPFCSQGEALVMEPLRLQWDMPDHPVAKHHLVAIGTVDKVHHATNTTCAAPPTVLDLLHAPLPHR